MVGGSRDLLRRVSLREDVCQAYMCPCVHVCRLLGSGILMHTLVGLSSKGEAITAVPLQVDQWAMPWEHTRVFTYLTW